MAGIEAMAAGLPLISSNVHGILDYVIDGKTGFACKPNDISGFSNAISVLYSDIGKRNMMSINCEKMIEPFEINNALSTMWKIYEEILQEIMYEISLLMEYYCLLYEEKNM